MKKFTMTEIESYLSRVRRAGACKGNMDMTEAAYASGDIEELKAIARGNINWLRGSGIPVTLDDLGDGIARTYHSNGQLMGQCTYENGQEQGLYQRWYDNGQLMEQYTFENGQEQGLYQRWYDNGQLMEQYTYENGQRG